MLGYVIRPRFRIMNKLWRLAAALLLFAPFVAVGSGCVWGGDFTQSEILDGEVTVETVSERTEAQLILVDASLAQDEDGLANLDLSTKIQEVVQIEEAVATARIEKVKWCLLYPIGDLLLDPLVFLFFQNAGSKKESMEDKHLEITERPNEQALGAPIFLLLSPLIILGDLFEPIYCINHKHTHRGSALWEPLAALLPGISNRYDFVEAVETTVWTSDLPPEIYNRIRKDERVPQPTGGLALEVLTQSGKTLGRVETKADGCASFALVPFADVLDSMGDVLTVQWVGGSTQLAVGKATKPQEVSLSERVVSVLRQKLHNLPVAAQANIAPQVYWDTAYRLLALDDLKRAMSEGDFRGVEDACMRLERDKTDIPKEVSIARGYLRQEPLVESVDDIMNSLSFGKHSMAKEKLAILLQHPDVDWLVRKKAEKVSKAIDAIASSYDKEKAICLHWLENAKKRFDFDAIPKDIDDLRARFSEDPQAIAAIHDAEATLRLREEIESLLTLKHRASELEPAKAEAMLVEMVGTDPAPALCNAVRQVREEIARVKALEAERRRLVKLRRPLLKHLDKGNTQDAVLIQEIEQLKENEIEMVCTLLELDRLRRIFVKSYTLPDKYYQTDMLQHIGLHCTDLWLKSEVRKSYEKGELTDLFLAIDLAIGEFLGCIPIADKLPNDPRQLPSGNINLVMEYNILQKTIDGVLLSPNRLPQLARWVYAISSELSSGDPWTFVKMQITQMGIDAQTALRSVQVAKAEEESLRILDSVGDQHPVFNIALKLSVLRSLIDM